MQFKIIKIFSVLMNINDINKNLILFEPKYIDYLSLIN